MTVVLVRTFQKKSWRLYIKSEKRYAGQVPPGYCDEKNKKGQSKRSLYGDLIVWKQTIQHCKDQKKHLIFVTDDHKPDWWEKVEGKNSPRKELIKEFVDNTGYDILIYDSQRFLEYAKANNDYKVSSKTIKEIGKVRKLRSHNWKAMTEAFAKLYNSLDYNQQLDILQYNYTVPSVKLSEYMNSLTGLSNTLESYKKIQENLEAYQKLYGGLLEESDEC